MACAIPLGRIFSIPPSGSFIIWLILLPSSGLSSVSPNNPTTPLSVFQKHPHCHLSSSWGYELLQIRELVFSTEFPKYKSYCPEKVPGMSAEMKWTCAAHCWRYAEYLQILSIFRCKCIWNRPHSSYFPRTEMWASATLLLFFCPLLILLHLLSPSHSFLSLFLSLIKHSLIHLDLT